MSASPVRKMTRAEAGRLGGCTTRAKLGPDHFQLIGLKGGLETKARTSPERYSEMARLGGAVTKSRYGSEHYKKIKLAAPRAKVAKVVKPPRAPRVPKVKSPRKPYVRVAPPRAPVIIDLSPIFVSDAPHYDINGNLISGKRK